MNPLCDKVGLVGALVGGFIIGFFINASYGLIGSIIVAFIGALILTAIVRTTPRCINKAAS